MWAARDERPIGPQGHSGFEHPAAQEILTLAQELGCPATGSNHHGLRAHDLRAPEFCRPELVSNSYGRLFN